MPSADSSVLLRRVLTGLRSKEISEQGFRDFLATLTMPELAEMAKMIIDDVAKIAAPNPVIFR
jgi:hypothetical protein